MKFARSVIVSILFLTVSVQAQTTSTSTDDDANVKIATLRNALIDSFNAGNLDQLLSHLDPDVLVTWQNGEVCRGAEQVRAYYDRMMSGPNRVVQKVRAEPSVNIRHVYGDWAVSSGDMNDHFTLTDGRELSMNSRFTACLAKRNGEWKVISFHASINAFDNSILSLAIRKTMLWSSVIAGVIGLAAGVILCKVLRRKST